MIDTIMILLLIIIVILITIIIKTNDNDKALPAVERRGMARLARGARRK